MTPPSGWGAGDVRNNLALLQAARQANPDAVLIYKPHPDVEAGLRHGAIPARMTWTALADVIVPDGDADRACWTHVDEVWTMTSLLGFEALLRGKPVTCLGAPFYAGWGLTRDLGPIPDRRLRRADGNAATPARYHRPGPCHADRLSALLRPGQPPALPARGGCRTAAQEARCHSPGPFNRILAKLQGRFASHAHLWRQLSLSRYSGSDRSNSVPSVSAIG